MNLRLVYVLVAALLVPQLVRAEDSTSAIPSCHAAEKKPKKAERIVRYVGAKSAPLYVSPSPQAEIRLQIPIATVLSIDCQDQGWLHVWAPLYQGIVGWLNEDLVQSEEPTLPGLLQQAQATADLGSRRRLGELAVALAPLEESAHLLLIDALRQQGDTAASAQAQGRLESLRHPQVKQDPGEVKLILVIDGNGASPLAQLRDGKLESYPVPDETSEEKTQKTIGEFSQRYFEPGRAYYQYIRGGRDGMAVIQSKEEPSCASVVASIKRIPAGTQPDRAGIMTNFPLTTGAAPPARQVRPGEQRQLIHLARSILLKEKVPESDISRVLRVATAKDDGLEISAVAPKGKEQAPLLVATSNVEFPPDAAHPDAQYRAYSLVMIAAPTRAGRYAVSYQSFAKADYEQGFSQIHFLTHADIDMDGAEELIFSGSGYEWWWYQALGLKDGKWDLLVSGGGGGC